MTTIYDLSEQSPELSEFYAKYYAWIKRGAHPDRIRFRRRYGLCSNIGYLYNEYELYRKVVDEMLDQFYIAELDTAFPFNYVLSSYSKENNFKTAYKNPARIAWVKAHLV